MEEISCTFCYSNVKGEELFLSKCFRVIAGVLGVILVISGALNLAGVNAFSGGAVGPLFLSVGPLTLLATSFKRVKYKKDLSSKQSGVKELPTLDTAICTNKKIQPEKKL